jgi:hypothetical protein
MDYILYTIYCIVFISLLFSSFRIIQWAKQTYINSNNYEPFNDTCIKNINPQFTFDITRGIQYNDDGACYKDSDGKCLIQVQDVDFDRDVTRDLSENIMKDMDELTQNPFSGEELFNSTACKYSYVI